jgi:hypothetical protein
MADWQNLTRRASFASHQLLGWIFWDTRAKDNLAALGVPEGLGHYIVNRGAPLAPAGAEALFAAFYTIKREFVHFALNNAATYITNWHEVTVARDVAVRAGLEEMTPQIIAPFGALADDLWKTVDAIPASGRVLFAAHKSWPRPTDSLMSAWNALNCIREWRGDTHFGILLNDNIGVVEAGLLHDAWMGYPKEWIPRSRGADDAEILAALDNLSSRGFVTDGVVNDAGVEYRIELERRTDVLCEIPWRHFGEKNTLELLSILEPVGERYVQQINETAGENWMPAARPRRR